MLTHKQIWGGVDALAQRYALTPSGLAKLAGLDPTTFNKSKRYAANGAKPRWPSTESIAKVLEATGASFLEFAALAIGGSDYGRAIPLLGLAQAASDGYFDDAGFPSGVGWEEVSFPHQAHEGTYALEISGESMAPVYRPGDRIIVTPGVEVRPGDRIVVRTTGGEVMAKQLKCVTAQRIELGALNPAHPDRLIAACDIAWIARILWASQ